MRAPLPAPYWQWCSFAHFESAHACARAHSLQLRLSGGILRRGELKMGCLRQRKFLNLEIKDPLARIRRRRSTRQPPPTVRRHVARGVARRVVDACAQGAPQIAPPRAFRAARAGGERGAPRCCVALVPSSRDPARRPARGAMAPHPCKRRCRRPAAICEGQKPAGVAQHVPLDRVYRPSPSQRALAAHAAGRPVGALRVRARPRLAARGPQRRPQ